MKKKLYLITDKKIYGNPEKDKMVSELYIRGCGNMYQDIISYEILKEYSDNYSNKKLYLYSIDLYLLRGQDYIIEKNSKDVRFRLLHYDNIVTQFEERNKYKLSTDPYYSGHGRLAILKRRNGIIGVTYVLRDEANKEFKRKIKEIEEYSYNLKKNNQELFLKLKKEFEPNM